MAGNRLPPGVCLTIRRSPVCSQTLAQFALPRDGHVIVNPYVIHVPHMPLLFYVLPADTSHLQNLRTVTRFHMKTHIDDCAKLELKCFRSDRPAFEADIEYTYDDGSTKGSTRDVVFVQSEPPRAQKSGGAADGWVCRVFGTAAG